ncbi:glycoside hydrolase family 71/99-like protein [Poriferisphaera corsica]|nr:glycoside hydrolase family 71/99-like protein [Poriferisphaera corsica]
MQYRHLSKHIALMPLCLCLLIFITSTPALNANQHTPKKLLMHYMPWYKTPEIRGEWGQHWTGFNNQHNPEKLSPNGLPDIWSNYHPLIGPYDSSDPDVLEYHLLLMKIAGINGVIVDWYGIEDFADYGEIHIASNALFKATKKFNMDFAVCYEDRTVEYMVQKKHLPKENITQHLTQTMQWLEQNWFNQPNYVKVNDRPLLLNFGPIYIKDASHWQQAFKLLNTPPAFFPLHHLWKSVKADGGFTWVHPSAWNDKEKNKNIRRSLLHEFNYTSNDPNKIIPSALPGFNDVYENSYEGIDHRNGKTLQESLSATFAGQWPIIQLVTWNDYGEGTMIEPTIEFNYLFLEIIQDQRKIEHNPNFIYTKQDLRLPRQLFNLRKLKHTSQDQLDQIAQLIATGQTNLAHKHINKINSTRPQ